MEISLNARIYNDIKAKIETGIYKEDDILPTELQLQNVYGVSRAPVRQALGRLENEGLIVRRSGKGTFVANRQFWKLASLGGFRSEFLKKFEQVECIVLSVKQIIPNKKISELLETAPDESVVRIERMRQINGQAYQYLLHYIKGLDVEKVLRAGSIDDMPLFLAQNGLYLKTVREEIEAVPLPKMIAEKMSVSDKTPVLKIKRGAYDITNKMYEYMIYYTLTRKWHYRVQYREYF